MNELRDLYQEMILEHSRSPRNHRCIDDTEHKAEGYNPLCGDEVKIFVSLENERVQDVSFVGSGCAISMASASILTEILRGKTKSEAEELFGKFHSLVTGQNSETGDIGKLQVFAGVSEFPARVKCATLAWHTFRSALEEPTDDQGPVTTE